VSREHGRLVRQAERRLRAQLQRARGLDVRPPNESVPPTTIETQPLALMDGDAQARVDAWFKRHGMTPFSFQRDTWARYRAGESGLIHASTGTGKTLAAWLGPVMDAMDHAESARALKVVWLTPMRALAADTLKALADPLGELGLAWRVGLRTGDTPSADRARQDRKALQAMVTTPESLSLLISRAGHAEMFRSLEAVIVDEWHELIGSKRGAQVELALARLRAIAPALRIWGLSATLGNLDEACDVLLGGRPGALVAGSEPKSIVIDSLLPEDIWHYPWAGHLGTRAVAAVAAEIERGGTTLVFTNVRSQAEWWYRALLDRHPEWSGSIGLHHGSLDLGARRWVEEALRSGSLKAAVCTSSLDLGVDFSPVDRVIQIGSPKSVARVVQRAGRAGHQPGAASRITCVPTHALELIEAAAAREAVHDRAIEPRRPVEKPLDVLVQHVITLATGDGFRADAAFDEIRSTHAFRALTLAEWHWVLGFASGGGVLKAYPDYHRITLGSDGIYRVTDERMARRHRVQIGTILSDATVNVQYLRGGKLGTVEESFIAKLNVGDLFTIGGKAVEFVRMRDMTAWVRRAPSRGGVVPRWMGGKLSLSGELAHRIQVELERAAGKTATAPETLTLMPLLELQRRHSHVPAANDLLVETHRTREGVHVCVFPFAGRAVHAALAALMGWRLARTAPVTFSMAFNEYGFELLTARAFTPTAETILEALSEANASDDILGSVNAAELARRHFREIARVAGLVFQGYPGEGRSARQLQATSGLLFDVYVRHDPDNPLLQQARREVLERELEFERVLETLKALTKKRLVYVEPKRMTPLVLPLIAEQMRNTLTTEQVADRVARMQLAMQKPERRSRVAERV
jgi:ATP-dependent Lhr-like helicase